MTNETDSYDFDVALSFAGEDREYVEEVDQGLKAAGVKTFLDADYLADTWGADLVEFFDAIYRIRSRYAILFISRHYAEKAWPRHERRSALARALDERGPYVLPVRLDDTVVDGLRPTLGYLDARKTGTDGLVRAVTAKLAGRTTWHDAWPGDRVPRTERELAEVRTGQPPAWEYLLFAGRLYVGKESLEQKYLDHDVGYAKPSGYVGSAGDAAAFMTRSSAEVQRTIAILNTMMEQAIQQRAFGAPSTPGDPSRVEHLAMRWNSAYSDLMDWAARIRGMARDDSLNAALDLLARFVDLPIRQYREFVDDFVSKMDNVPSALAAKQHVEIQLILTLSMEDGLVEAFNDELHAIGG